LRLLLDTRALLWWLLDAPQLSPDARRFIADRDSEVFVSAASAWEVATKFRLGKLPEAERLAVDFEQIVADQGFVELPVLVGHALQAGSLRGAHKDPFDRMLIGQAIMERLALVSKETLFDAFGVTRVW